MPWFTTFAFVNISLTVDEEERSTFTVRTIMGFTLLLLLWLYDHAIMPAKASRSIITCIVKPKHTLIFDVVLTRLSIKTQVTLDPDRDKEAHALVKVASHCGQALNNTHISEQIPAKDQKKNAHNPGNE
jgi:hypothetical protein